MNREEIEQEVIRLKNEGCDTKMLNELSVRFNNAYDIKAALKQANELLDRIERNMKQ